MVAIMHIQKYSEKGKPWDKCKVWYKYQKANDKAWPFFFLNMKIYSYTQTFLENRWGKEVHMFGLPKIKLRDHKWAMIYVETKSRAYVLMLQVPLICHIFIQDITEHA